MFATQVLPETPSEDDSEEENNSDIVGFIILDDREHEVKKGETKIGRDSSMCSIVIENFTISKVHAVIESEGVDDTFIYDVGSTNQTKLGKKILKPHFRYKLDNNSKITLGNVVAKFVVSSHKTPDSPICQTKHPTVNLDAEELGDIFDLPTQACLPQPHTSSHVFENSSGNVSLFKVPNPVPSTSTSKSTLSFKVPQSESNSQETKLKTVFCDSSFENSAIFSLSTQCKLFESSATPENSPKTVADSDKNSESDKVTSLLNDGQDDVLCTFMSLHSPNDQTRLLKEVNIKTEIPDSENVFDAPTQAQINPVQESIEEKERRELSELLKNKDLIEEDFTSRNSCLPTTTSTPLNRKCVTNQTAKSNSSVQDEDFIETQQFVNSSESVKPNSDNQLEDDETQPYLPEEISMSETKNDEEDLILTQTFEVLNHQTKESTMMIQETEELNASQEDFIGTQIFPAEGGNRTPIPESPARDASSLNLTQRNNEDDFIATQVFEGATTDRKSGSSSERSNSDDEDFIATQTVDLPVNKTANNKNYQEDVHNVRAASRESSPDLLASESFSKNLEDCISTQIFEALEHRNITTTAESISSPEKKENSQEKVIEPEESSGEETESDLEIILETNAGESGSRKFFKSEREASISPQNKSPVLEQENDNSNSSYVFELEPKNDTEKENFEQKELPVAHLSDSDATDCEEIAIVSPKIKQEPIEHVEFEDTQVLTLTLPDNYAEISNSNQGVDAESPKFEVEKDQEPWSPLSLEMPNTQDIERTVSRVFQKNKREEKKEDFETPSKIKKFEVGLTNVVQTSRNLVGSPLKRLRESNNTEVIPIKKSKTEDKPVSNSQKLFSKLVKAHDFAHIQPSRTRNSVKNVENEPEVENNTNRPTSRRKTNGKKRSNTKNGDITSYLTKKEDKKSHNEKEPIEVSTRVLRSSRRNSGNGAPTPGRNVPSRKSPRNSCRRKSEEYFSSACVNIVFTGFGCESLENIIKELGGKKTNDVSAGQVVISDKVRRTVKFLCAIGLSLPITSPQWLLACKKEKKFLNPWNFILKDEESEDMWEFDLKASLEKSKKVKLLEGFSIFATKSTKPPVKELLAIVECCGGTPLFDWPDTWPKKTIIVSCLEDKKWWPLAKYRNVKIVHYEFILSGVLRQKIDFKTYTLR